MKPVPAQESLSGTCHLPGTLSHLSHRAIVSVHLCQVWTARYLINGSVKYREWEGAWRCACGKRQGWPRGKKINPVCISVSHIDPTEEEWPFHLSKGAGSLTGGVSLITLKKRLFFPLLFSSLIQWQGSLSGLMSLFGEWVISGGFTFISYSLSRKYVSKYHSHLNVL